MQTDATRRERRAAEPQPGDQPLVASRLLHAEPAGDDQRVDRAAAGLERAIGDELDPARRPDRPPSRRDQLDLVGAGRECSVGEREHLRGPVTSSAWTSGKTTMTMRLWSRNDDEATAACRNVIHRTFSATPRINFDNTRKGLDPTVFAS